MKRIRSVMLLLCVALLVGVPLAPAGVVISEFRTRGPNGAADEFVELYNNSDSPADISGWKINGSNSSGTTSTRVAINAGTTIPARGHFLATNSTAGTGYSGAVSGNQTYTSGIADDGGIALLMADNTVVDQVGMSAGSAYKEGGILTPLTASTDQGYERKPGGAAGSTQDTGDNANDFQIRSPSNPQNLSSPSTPVSLVVGDLGDNGGANQLRAIISACLSSGGGVITFSPGLSGTVTLISGPLPTITPTATPVAIDGGNVIEISGNNATRIFNVNSGATLTLKNVTLSHAYVNGDGGAVASFGALNSDHVKFLSNQTGASWSGSAILCWGPLSITNSEFAFNTGGGGAVKPRSSAATTTITGSNFHDNQSSDSGGTGTGYGGAMQIFDGPSVTISNSTFVNNYAAADGGAIYVTANSALNVSYTIFSGNQGGTDLGNGGAISLSTINSTLIVHDSTFSGNSAIFGSGGAIYNEGNANIFRVTFVGNEGSVGGLTNAGNATLENVTLFSNRFAIHTTDSLGYGGISLVNVTFSENYGSSGAGLSVHGSPSLTIRNTVFSTYSQLVTNCENVNGGDHSFSDDNSCGFAAGGGADNVPTTDFALSGLEYNGGFTQTCLPDPSSVLINRGTATAAPTRDQRGYVRDAVPDVGAVEVGGSLLPAPTSVMSVKSHAATVFGVNLPLTGSGAVECRSGGTGGNHQIILNFPNPVTLSGASVSNGTGSVSSYSITGSQVTINLTGVANAQHIFTTLLNVSDGTANANDITVPMGVLLGDVNGSARVDAADVSSVRQQTLQPITSSNFRDDINVSGRIDAADVSVARQQTLTSLP